MSKKQSKSARIRKMLDQGKSVKQIAATVQCAPQLVYQIRSADNKQKQNGAKSVVEARKIIKAKADKLPKVIDEVTPGAWKLIYSAPPKQSLWTRFKSWLVA